MDRIKNISDLLDKILKKNILQAKEYHESDGTRHPTLLGDIYEGITSNLLEKTLFEHLDLKVVSGQVRLHNGQLSNQMDCMIVKKTGRKIPFTDKFECEIDDVIAVIEVKKTLYKDELEDSLLKMQKITEGFDVEKTKNGLIEEEIYRGYEVLTGRTLDDIDFYTGKNIDKSNFTSVLVNSLILDYLTPLRIVFGFNGYTNEKSLRDGFVNILTNNSNIKMGPRMLPNLIICKESCLIKTNGIPYGLRTEKETNNKFNGLASYSSNPILVLLEILWSKLCNVFPEQLNSNIFGFETKYENIVPLLMYSFEQYEGKYGFAGEILNLKDIQRKTLRSNGNLKNERVNISIVAHVVFMMLSSGKNVSILDKEFRKYCAKEKTSLIELKKELLDTGYIKFRKDKILLRTIENLIIQCDKDGYFIMK